MAIQHIFGLKKFLVRKNVCGRYNLGFLHRYSEIFIVVAEIENESTANALMRYLNAYDVSRPIEKPLPRTKREILCDLLDELFEKGKY